MSRQLDCHWEKASNAHGIVREELYKLSAGYLDLRGIVSKEHMFAHLLQKSNYCFEFIKYASKGMTRSGNEYTLVVAEVLLGDSIDSEKLYKHKKKKIEVFLEENKKDSIIKKQAGEPAIYSVYDNSQIRLCYIIHFSTEAVDEKQEHVIEEALKNLPEGETVMELSKINLRDVSDPLIEVVQKAISLYKGDCSQRDSYTQSKYPLKEIVSVGIIVNLNANRMYEEKASECKANGWKFTEVYAYHATKPENVDSIIKNNLDPHRVGAAHGAYFGNGCYFSEHPSFSFVFSQETMFIFKLLLIEKQYTKVEPDKKGFCRELVLNDASLFKPQFVLHF